MKHLQPYTEYIRESAQERDPNQIYSMEYISLLGKRQLKPINEFDDEDKVKLEELCKFLSDSTPADQKITSTYPTGLESTIIIGGTTYPRLYMGKQSDNSWTLRTQDENPAVALSEKYYHFPSIEEMIRFIAANYGPKINWSEIK